MNQTDHVRPRGTDQHTETRHVEAAARYLQQRQAFHVHAAVFAGGMAVIVLVNLATNVAAGIAGDWSAWWSAWAFVGWGSGIAVHGLVVRINRPASSTTS